jgi:CheY-like chemotaxis protein
MSAHVTRVAPDSPGTKWHSPLLAGLAGDDVTDPNRHPASSEETPGPPGRAHLDGTQVLVLDDYEEGAEALCELLTTFGFDARAAYDGPSALALAATFRPKTCLLDLDVPVMDGYEVARRLRELLGSDLTLLALTGYGREEDRLKTAQAGFAAHLVKPLDLDELIALLSGS